MRALCPSFTIATALLAQACASGPGGSAPEESKARTEAVSACAEEATPAAASSNGDDGHVAANVLDGDLGTRWSRDGKGSLLTIDLAQPTDVGGVSLAWYKGDKRKATFSVSVSTDGTSFQKVAGGKSSGKTVAPELVSFPPVAGAKRVRIKVDGNNVNSWASITEADVCASGSGGPGGSGSGGSGGGGMGGAGGSSGNVLWTSTVALSVDTQLTPSKPYAKDLVVLPSHAGDSGPHNHEIDGGFYTLDGDRVRLYLDIYRKEPAITESELQFYAVRGSGTENISTKYGNHGTDGFEFDGQYVFGGYGVSFHQNQVESKVEYFHNEQGSSKSFTLAKPLQTGKLYGYRIAKENVGSEVWMNAWVDYMDGNGWVHVMTDRKWTQSDWKPGDVPSGTDEKAVENGVYLGPCLHWWIRANGGGTVKWKDAQISEL